MKKIKTINIKIIVLKITITEVGKAINYNYYRIISTKLNHANRKIYLIYI